MYHSIESAAKKMGIVTLRMGTIFPHSLFHLSGCVQVTNQQESEARETRKENESPCMLNELIGLCTGESNKRREVLAQL